MKSVYERTNLIITEFDTEDVIITSGSIDPSPEPEPPLSTKRENAYDAFGSYNGGVYF